MIEEKLMTKSYSKRSIEKYNYFIRLLTMSILIGILCAICSLILYFSIKFFTKLFLEQIAGYNPPEATINGVPTISNPKHSFLIPISTTLGGLISGLIVYKFAPVAEGHGSDAAIYAFHNKNGNIKGKVSIVKLIASAITIGSGGSAGKEGPIILIGAGCGSFIGRKLKLNHSEKRIAMVAGMGAGIGSIFKAPLGGALLACEILYLADFEIDALIPSLIASITSYTIFGSIAGWNPVYLVNSSYYISSASSLILYFILGTGCGLIGLLFIKSFYKTKNFFSKLKIPNYIKPAIGGLATGLIGIFFPQILGTGEGWLQLVMIGNLKGPILILLIFSLLKITATSFSVGSGGSGGTLFPSLVIGGTFGAFMFNIFKSVFPTIEINLIHFTIIGMISLFASIGKTPISIIIMISELTGSYLIIIPTIISIIPAYLITGKNTIYRSQVDCREKSPAHNFDYSVDLLKEFKVKDFMKKDAMYLTPDKKIKEAYDLMKEKEISFLIIKNYNDELVGILTEQDLIKSEIKEFEQKKIIEIINKNVVTCFPEENLNDVLKLMIDNEISELPVVNTLNKNKVIGVITLKDIAKIFDFDTYSYLINNRSF